MPMRYLVTICLSLGCLSWGASSAAAGTPRTADDVDAANRQYAVAAGFQNQQLYGTAIEEWRSFLKRFPNDHRRHQAEHYLGTCYLQEQTFEPAIAALEKALAAAKDFRLREESLLNYGIACYGLATQNESKRPAVRGANALGDLLQQFPRSDFAADALYYRAECLLLADNPTDAAKSFRTLLKRFPEHDFAAEAQYALATTLTLLRDNSAAQQIFEAFLKQYPNHQLQPDVRYGLAELLFRDSQFKQAERLFERLSRNTGCDRAEDSLLRQARCLYELQRYEQAGQTYWNVPRTFRDTQRYDHAVLAGAKCYLLAKKYETARSGLQRLVTRDVPEAAEAARWLAQSYLDEGRTADALQQAERAMTKFSKSSEAPEIELVRLDAMSQLDRPAHKVAAAYLKFAQRYAEHPKVADAHYLAASRYLQAADYASVLTTCNQFRTQHGNHSLRPDIDYLQAETLLQQKDFAAAATAFQQLLKQFPDHAQSERATVRLALALHLQNRHADAAHLLQNIVRRTDDSQLKAQSVLLLGRAYLASSDAAQAVTVLEQLRPTETSAGIAAEALLVRAEAYSAIGNPAAAAAAWQQIANDYADSTFAAEAVFRLAEQAAAQEQYEQAIDVYQRMIREFPESELCPNAHLGLGWAYLHAGESEACQQISSLLIKAFPKAESAAQALYLRSLAHYRTRRFEDSVRDADEFLRSAEATATAAAQSDALYVKGLALAGLNQHQDAVQTWQQILKSKLPYTDADKVLYETAWSLAELHKVQESAAAFARLADEHPGSELAAESRFRVGEVYYEAERFAEAATAYSRCAESAAGEILEKALHKTGWCYLKQKQFAKAQAAFDQQSEQFPDGSLSNDARFLTAECLYHQQEHAAAYQRFQKTASAAAGSHTALAMYRAGECAAMLEDWPASRRWYQTVLQQQPKFPMRSEAKYGQAWALQNQQKFESAIELYEQVTEETNSETAAKARFMIGECCFALKQHDAAARHFLKVTFLYDHDRWTPLAFFEAGRCFEVLRDLPQARSCYQQLLDKYPTHDKAAATKGRMQLLAER